MGFVDWFKNASATFAGGAVAIGILAIPTYIWLPREFDDLRKSIDVTSHEAEQTKMFSEKSAELGDDIVDRLTSLITSIARMDAKPLDPASLILDPTGSVILAQSDADAERFMELLPRDVLAEIIGDGALPHFLFSTFDGNNWVFIDPKPFSEFNFAQQRAIEQSFERSNVSFGRD